MTLDDLVPVLIFGSFFLLLAWEAWRPARAYPTRKLWRLRGFGFLVMMGALATAIPLLMPGEWLARHRVLDLSRLSIVPGAIVGYAVVSLASYGWHRAAHRFDFLWRTFHQLHHAPQRMDMGGAAIFHPLEVVVFITISTLVTTLVLGLSAPAAALTGLVAQLYSFFQHANVCTPRWLGYLIQRPEAHFVHHRRDVHAFNYGDLPIWDLLFGTFRNPEGFGDEEVGFAAPADERYGAMFLGKDVAEAIGTRVQRPQIVSDSEGVGVAAGTASR